MNVVYKKSLAALNSLIHGVTGINVLSDHVSSSQPCMRHIIIITASSAPDNTLLSLQFELDDSNITGNILLFPRRFSGNAQLRITSCFVKRINLNDKTISIV